jgi:hypothetical protein
MTNSPRWDWDDRSALPGGDKEIPDEILDRVMQEVDKLPQDQRGTDDESESKFEPFVDAPGAIGAKA